MKSYPTEIKQFYDIGNYEKEVIDDLYNIILLEAKKILAIPDIIELIFFIFTISFPNFIYKSLLYLKRIVKLIN